MLETVTKVIGWIIQVLPIFIILRPRPRTYASTSSQVTMKTNLLAELKHQAPNYFSAATPATASTTTAVAFHHQHNLFH